MNNILANWIIKYFKINSPRSFNHGLNIKIKPNEKTNKVL